MNLAMSFASFPGAPSDLNTAGHSGLQNFLDQLYFFKIVNFLFNYHFTATISCFLFYFIYLFILYCVCGLK